MDINQTNYPCDRLSSKEEKSVSPKQNLNLI